MRLTQAVLWIGIGLAMGSVSEDRASADDAKPEQKSAAQDVPDFLRALAEADKIILYSIDGTERFEKKQAPKTNEEFRGYPVLGKTTIADAKARYEIVGAAKQATDKRDAARAKCFWPRHALHVESKGKCVDYVICFQCVWFKVIDGESVRDIGMEAHDKLQTMLNRHLKDAKIEIAP
jgi:hypothetical protein